MKITSKWLGFLLVLFFIVGISSTMVAGLWATENTKEPSKYKDEAYSDLYNPEDIKGSYTFADVSKYFEIDEDVLRQAFRIDEKIDLNIFATKDLETLYGENEIEIGNGSVKLFVALYSNLPYNLDEDYLLEEAVEMIKVNNRQLTAEQLTFLDTHVLKYEDLIVSEIDTSALKDESSDSDETFKITGNTTFKQVLDAGITETQIIEILGAEMPQTNLTIKSYCEEHNLEYSVIKNKIIEILP